MAATADEAEALRINNEGKSVEDASRLRSAQDDQSISDPVNTGHHEPTPEERGSASIESQTGQDECSEKPYSSFSTREKWVIIVLISLASVFS